MFAVGGLGYNAVLAVHILAVIAWMAGMLYLPRLFVYHAMPEHAAAAPTLEVMERKLLKLIMNGSLIAVWVTGLALAVTGGWFSGQGWLHAKLLLVLVMSGVHGWFGVLRKKFLQKSAPMSHKTLRMVNELPFVILIPIVALVIFKPF